ncbi:MAG: hypothetical protein Salg2KO_21680 [Salibacteraceae bacterium]
MLSTAYGLYLGYTISFYRLGVILVLGIHGLSLIVFVLAYFISGRHTKDSLMVAAVFCIGLQTAYIVATEVDRYKPTVTITIPDQVVGCVYLLVTPGPRVDVQVNEHGIGYIGSIGEVTYEIEHRGHDITDAFQTSGAHEIALYNPDSTTLTAYNVTCLNITGETEYKTPVMHPFLWCMDTAEFSQFVQTGMIDETRLRKRVWRGSGDGKDWTLDHDQSKL